MFYCGEARVIAYGIVPTAMEGVAEGFHLPEPLDALSSFKYYFLEACVFACGVVFAKTE